MKVAIIGAGKAGRTLGRLARAAGHEIGPVVSRTRERAEEAVAFIGAGDAGTRPVGSELTLLTVPDAVIAEVARALPPSDAMLVAHICGSLGTEVLRPHAPAGSLHPLRSFGDPARAAELFPGTACAVNGDDAAVEPLSDFCRSIGGEPLRILPDRKALYHAGAVFASNYVVAVLEAGIRLLVNSGVTREEAARALTRLTAGTAANIEAVGATRALTGPVERGDTETVRRHLASLREHDPGLAGTYADLGRIAIDMARAKGSLDDASAERMERALCGEEGAR